MKKGTIKALAILSIPVMYVLIKQNIKTDIPMTATEIKKENEITKIKVESENYYKTITIPNDSLAISDLPNMYYLSNDNINYRLCKKIKASKLNLDTDEVWIEEVYYDIEAKEVLKGYKYILTSEEFNERYGISKEKVYKLTIVE